MWNFTRPGTNKWVEITNKELKTTNKMIAAYFMLTFYLYFPPPSLTSESSIRFYERLII